MSSLANNSQSSVHHVGLAIVGAGMACARLVNELVAAGHAADQIAVFGDELHAPYNRVQLSAVLAGDTPLDGINMLDPDWCQQQGIELYLGDKVVDADLDNKQLSTASNRQFQFQRLIFATGSQAIQLPIPGADNDGVMVFRRRTDVESLIDFAKTSNQSAVIVGGGLLGLEAAYGLQKLGVETHVINRADFVMNRQIDRPAAHLLENHLAKLGITLHADNSVAEILGDQKVTGVRLENGKTIEASLVIFAIGIFADIELAKTTSLAINRGIIVDGQLNTSVKDVYALGECAEFDGQTVGIVAPIWQQVTSLVANLMGQQQAYEHQAHATQLKVSGVDVFSAGQCSETPVTDHTAGAAGQQDIVISDPESGVYRRLSFVEQKLSGTVLLGDRSHGLDYEQIINDGSDRFDNDQLMFSLTEHEHDNKKS